MDKSISFIQIDVNSGFEVKLNTEKTDEVYVEAQIEGEYTKDLELEMEEEGDTLLINTGLSQFQKPQR